MNTEPIQRLLLRATEAAELTGVGRSKAYEFIANGTWPSVRMGGCVRVPLESLRRWIDEQTRNKPKTKKTKVK